MDPVLQLEMMTMCRDRLIQGQADVAGHEVPLSTDRYVSPDQFAAERETIFRDYPVVVAFASQLVEPGSYVTRDVGDVPVVVLRDRAGVLRAYMNVCRHRGARLLNAACGKDLRAIVCPYHAWTYELTSGIRHIPHGAAGFPDLDQDERPLVALPVAERHGLVFVTPTPAGKDATLGDNGIDAWLGPLMRDLESFGFGDHVLYAPSTRRYRMNWKLMMDTTYEAYHFRFAHAQSIYPMFPDNIGVYDWDEPHARMVLPKRTMQSVEIDGTQRHDLRAHANIVYGIFPNTAILVQPDQAMVMTSVPIAVDQTDISVGMLIPKGPLTEKAIVHWDKNEAVFWSALDEDYRIAESMQSTHRSGANSTILFGRYEHMVPKFHAAVDARIAPALKAARARG